MGMKISQIPDKGSIALLTDKNTVTWISLSGEFTGKALRSFVRKYFDIDNNGVLDQKEQVNLYKRLKPYVAEEADLTFDELEKVKNTIFAEKYGKTTNEIRDLIETATDFYKQQDKRLDAVKDLCRIARGSNAASLALLKIIQGDPDFGLVYEAIKAFGSIGVVTKDAVSIILNFLIKFQKKEGICPYGNPALGSGIHTAADETLAKLAPKSVDYLAEILASSGEIFDRRALSATLLINEKMRGKVSEKAKSALIKALSSDEQGVVRAQAAAAAGVLKIETAVPHLIKALEDGDARVRQDAVFALYRINTKRKDVQDALLKLIKKEEDPEVITNIIVAFGDMKDRAGETLPHIIKALKHENDKVSVWAISALDKLGKAAIPAIPDLERIVNNEKEEIHIRERAQKVLDKLKILRGY